MLIMSPVVCQTWLWLRFWHCETSEVVLRNDILRGIGVNHRQWKDAVMPQ